MCANMKFILSVEQDISRVSKANELDILCNTRNKFHIFKHPSMYSSVNYTKHYPYKMRKLIKMISAKYDWRVFPRKQGYYFYWWINFYLVTYMCMFSCSEKWPLYLACAQLAVLSCQLTFFWQLRKPTLHRD